MRQIILLVMVLLFTASVVYADVITFEERQKETPDHVQGKVFIWNNWLNQWASAPIGTTVTVFFHSNAGGQPLSHDYTVWSENGDFNGNMPGYDETDPELVNEYDLAEYIFRGSSYYKYFSGSVNLWIYWHTAF